MGRNQVSRIAAATLVIALAMSTGCSTLSPADATRRAVEALNKNSPSGTISAEKPEAPRTTLPSLDWSIADGHFFTQTNGKSIGTSATGFSVTNQGGMLFWQKFEELGGVRALGYPVSRRFTWRGSPTQVFQRGVLQWDVASGQMTPLNTLDVLSNVGKDEWLRTQHATPLPLPADFDTGKPWSRIVSDRLTLLKGNKAIDRYYLGARDPIALYGLPTSKIEDFGEHVTVRFQRAVIREWKVDRMGFKAGEIAVENVGEWAIEVGLFPKETLEPESAPPAASGEPGTRSQSTQPPHSRTWTWPSKDCNTADAGGQYAGHGSLCSKNASNGRQADGLARQHCHAGNRGNRRKRGTQMDQGEGSGRKPGLGARGVPDTRAAVNQ